MASQPDTLGHPTPNTAAYAFPCTILWMLVWLTFSFAAIGSETAIPPGKAERIALQKLN
jgi:hypothetical protein